MGRDVEGVLKLMGRPDRGDMLDMSRLNNFRVDRFSSNRSGPEWADRTQEASPGSHGTRDRDAPPLSSRQFRRRPIDVIL